MHLDALVMARSADLVTTLEPPSAAPARPVRASGRRLLVGVAGGSGSGKTTLAQELVRIFGEAQSCLVMQDSYYFDQSARFDGDGGSVNFDHPSSLDFALLARQLLALRDGQAVEVPCYDFATHTRAARTVTQPARPVIVVDGTLILEAPEVRELFDVAVFVSCSEATRFGRRLERDVRERGRTPEGVHKQFHRQVKPMHDAFVEPSQRNAHLSVDGEGELTSALGLVLERLDALGRPLPLAT